MNEATTTVKSKPAKPVAPVSSIFELPKFDLPKFDLPKLEVPAAFREIAEKGVAQAKDAYERVKASLAAPNPESCNVVLSLSPRLPLSRPICDFSRGQCLRYHESRGRWKT